MRSVTIHLSSESHSDFDYAVDCAMLQLVHNRLKLILGPVDHGEPLIAILLPDED